MSCAALAINEDDEKKIIQTVRKMCKTLMEIFLKYFLRLGQNLRTALKSKPSKRLTVVDLALTWKLAKLTQHPLRMT